MYTLNLVLIHNFFIVIIAFITKIVCFLHKYIYTLEQAILLLFLLHKTTKFLPYANLNSLLDFHFFMTTTITRNNRAF